MPDKYYSNTDLYFSGRSQGGEVGESPGEKAMDVGHKALAKGSERVFDARRYLGVDRTRYQGVALKISQGLRQYFG